MSELISAGAGLEELEAEFGRLESLPTEAVYRELAEGVRMTLAGVVRVAACVRVLEGRGEDLSSIRDAAVNDYRRVAHGQMLPGVFVRFVAAPLLRKKIAALPLPDQRRLADGGAVELIVRREEGWDSRMADPLKLTRDQIHQVFGDDHVRTPAEQKLILEAKSAAPAAPAPARKARADRERGGVAIGRAFAERSDVLAALADLSGDEDGEAERTHSAVAKLTEEEHRRLAVASARSGVPMGELVRRALRAGGLI